VYVNKSTVYIISCH